MLPNRPLGMYHEHYIIMWALMLLALAIFGSGIYDHYRRWQLGVPETRTCTIAGLKRFLQQTGQHRRLLNEAYPGIMHSLIFYGFVIFALGTLSIAIDEDLGLPIFRGGYYLILSAALDLFGLGVVVGVMAALWRRLIDKPPRLETRPDDLVALIFILAIILTGFWVEAVRILITHDPWANWSPVGKVLAGRLAFAPESTLKSLHQFLWWLHLLLSFGFIAYIPKSKLIHIITGMLNQCLAKDKAAQSLVPLDLEDESLEQYGVGQIQEFTWKQLLDGDACVRCGRCQDNCPAHLTGKPLSPKEFTQDLREQLHAIDLPQQPTAVEAPQTALVPEVIAEDTVWSCTTCRSCEEQCPMFVEHVPKIIDLRRNLVLMESNFPPEAQLAFRGLENNANPWNISWKARADWAQELRVTELAVNDNVEYLFWPGCSGAFDNRNKKVTMAIAKLLQAANISFGILGQEEKCCGDSARRLGNEYLYQSLAKENIEMLQNYGVKKIITSCPHCLNTLKNEYPQFGGYFQVLHHTELLGDLVAQGQLLPKHKLAQTCTYHDSCYLGRYNDIYEEPRSLIAQIPGLSLSEMATARSRSFCCGAGGGRMWLEENLGQRINVVRTEQALETGANLIVTACPFCLTMLEDGTKYKDVVETVKTKDLAELLWESLSD